MDKLSRLSTSISIPIPNLLLIPRSLEAAICRGSRPKLYNIYQQKRVYSSQEALIAESERLYVCNERSLQAATLTMCLRWLGSLKTTPHLSTASQPTGRVRLLHPPPHIGTKQSCFG